ncbi:OsmC family protein [Spongiivirga sp. MCCC 1A20706]|uniref:OsmC family protein n=1 Tax=Spongiivirga sp. MCCC 1A20706 TaxID=3160963 RepID=UPI00397774F3
MKISLERVSEDFHFVAVNGRGNEVHIDNSSVDNPQGTSPMELLLMGVAGCSAIDVVAILNKQRQEITAYKAEVSGDRIEIDGAKPFKDVHVTISLEGNISPEKAQRAATLSFDKYCSVSKTMEPGVTMHYKVILNGKEV